MKVQQVLGKSKAVMHATLLLSPLFVLTTLLSTSASAQEIVQPVPVYQVEHTSFNDRNLYIRGGLNQGRFVAQFFSLDISPLLSYSNKLTWKKLNEVGPVTDFRSHLPMAVNRQNQALTYFYEAGRMTTYNLMLNTWMSSTILICLSPDNPKDTVRGHQKAVMDPKTGLMYIPQGYNLQTEMLVFDPTGNSCSSLPMPANANWYNHVWSESKDTIYMYGTGATQQAEVPASLWEFQFATKSWKSIPIQGDTPIMHKSNCMTSAYNGQKLIVYGGATVDDVYGDIFIFDTVTSKWTVGPRSPTNRTEVACASSGDFFLAWGGFDAPTGFLSPPEILFYNIKLNKWMTQAEIAPPPANVTATFNATFTGTVTPLPTNTTAPVLVPDQNHPGVITTTTPGMAGTGLPITDSGHLPVESKTNNGAAAIGGGVAGVVFIAAFVGFLFYRRGKKAGVKGGDLNEEAFPGDNSDEVPPSPGYQQAPFAPNSYNAYQDSDAIDTLYAANSAAVYTTPYNPAYPPCTTASAPSPPYTEADESSPYLTTAASSPYSAAGSHGAPESSHTDADPEDRTIYPLPTATPIAAYQRNDWDENSKGDTKTDFLTTPSAPQLPFSDKNNRQSMATLPTSSYMPQIPQGFQQDRNQSDSASNPQPVPPPLSPISRNHSHLQGGSMAANETPMDAKEKMALAQVEDEQNMERMRQEQKEELERMREDKKPRRSQEGL